MEELGARDVALLRGDDDRVLSQAYTKLKQQSQMQEERNHKKTNITTLLIQYNTSSSSSSLYLASCLFLLFLLLPVDLDVTVFAPSDKDSTYNFHSSVYIFPTQVCSLCLVCQTVLAMT